MVMGLHGNYADSRKEANTCGRIESGLAITGTILYPVGAMGMVLAFLGKGGWKT